MAQRVERPARTLGTVKSEKQLPKKESALTTNKHETNGYCRCVCKKCGHGKHEQQEKLFRQKLEVETKKATMEATRAPQPTTKPSNIRSPKTQDHQTGQRKPETEVQLAKGTCCNCCSSGVCLNYKGCPNTSAYMESEALRRQLQDNEIRKREVQVFQNHRQEEVEHEQEVPRQKCYVSSNRQPLYNQHKEQQFDRLNSRVCSNYHAVRKQLQLASDPYDFAGEYRQDRAHCPYRMPNHRNYQWQNHILPKRYNCPQGEGCRIYCGVDPAKKCCLPKCCPSNNQ